MVKDRLKSTLLSRSKWRDARWLVLAPHADDETLGCGALIAESAAAGRLAGVAVLTDGGGSHPCETSQARRRLISLREQEARAAMRILAPQAAPPLFLAWPDAAPFPATSRARRATVARLLALCARRRVDAIAVTGHHEPHCDHVAAHEVALAVATRATRPTTLFEYLVWAEAPPGLDFSVVRTAPVSMGCRRLALAQHRSQLTPLHGEGFRVPPALRRMPASDLLYTRARR